MPSVHTPIFIPLKVESSHKNIFLKVESNHKTIPLQIAAEYRAVTGDPYLGPYVVDPTFREQTLETRNKLMTDDVTVNPIEVSRTSNPAGGITVYIGGIINA